MNEFIVVAWQQAQQQSSLEMLAVLLSVAYVVLAARQNSWCWPCAFISTSIFVYLFWETTVIFHMLLNIYYIVMAVIGYLSWNKGKLDSAEALEVKRLSIEQYAILLCSGSGITVLLVIIGSQFFSSEWIWLDAATSVFAVLTTVLTVRKYIDNWFFWMLINPLSGYLMFQNGLNFTTLLMAIYTIMAVYGYFQWKRDLPTEV